jgi:hypothetical protein
MPECSQVAATFCTSYKGKKQSTPHKSRAELYAKEFPDRVALYQKIGIERTEKILLFSS